MCRLGRFSFYRMVPRHTDGYSLCTSGEPRKRRSWEDSSAGVGWNQGLVPWVARQHFAAPCCPLPLPPPAAALLMCRFAAPLAFNFIAAVALPETKGGGAPVSPSSQRLLALEIVEAVQPAGQRCGPTKRPSNQPTD